MHKRSDWHEWGYNFRLVSSFERPFFAPSVSSIESRAILKWNWFFLRWNAQRNLNCNHEEKARSKKKINKAKWYELKDHRHIQGSC